MEKSTPVVEFNAAKFVEDHNLDISSYPVRMLGKWTAGTNATKEGSISWIAEETQAAVRRWLTREPEMPSLRSDFEDHEFLKISLEDIEFSKAIDAAANKFIKKNPVNLAEQWLVYNIIMNSGFDAHKNRDRSYTMVSSMFNR